MDSLLATLDIKASAFADDLKFITILKKYYVDSIQLKINRVYDWSISMGVPLSVFKLLVMHYGSNNPCHVYYCGPTVLESSENFSELGVLRTSNGQLHDPITSTAKKERCLYGMIHKIIILAVTRPSCCVFLRRMFCRLSRTPRQLGHNLCDMRMSY